MRGMKISRVFLKFRCGVGEKRVEGRRKGENEKRKRKTAELFVP